ncbi:MAG: LemA family protein [Burkholderiaceae bacterium]
MPDLLVIAIAALALVLFWAVGAYNRLVRLRAAIGTAFAALDARYAERLAWIGDMLKQGQQPTVVDPGAGAPEPPPTLPSWARLRAASEQWALALAAVRAQPGDGDAVGRLVLAHSALQAAWTGIPVQDWASRVAIDATPALVQWERLRHQEQPLALAFNAAVHRYNAAARQFPAALMARLCGFHAAQTLPLLEEEAP